MLTIDEFGEFFYPFASQFINSTGLLNHKIIIWYDKLKGHPLDILKKVGGLYIDQKINKLPHVIEFKDLISIFMKYGKITLKEDDEYYMETDEYKKSCETPAALKSKKIFMDKMRGYEKELNKRQPKK